MIGVWRDRSRCRISVGGLEPVHLRHLHVQQHHRELVREEPLERLAPRVRRDEVLAQPLEHRLEGDQVGRLVVDQEDVDQVGRAVGRSGSRADGASPVDLVIRPAAPTRLIVRPADRLTA